MSTQNRCFLSDQHSEIEEAAEKLRQNLTPAETK